MSLVRFSDNNTGRYGLKDSVTGSIILPCKYLGIGPFQYNNRVVVLKEAPDSYLWTQSINGVRYTEGLFDVEHRRFVLDCDYRGIWPFDENTGLACVVKRHDGHSSGYINKDGVFVIPMIYDMPLRDTFDTNKAITLKYDGKYGVVDYANKTRLPFEYDNSDAGQFYSSEPLSLICRGDRWGYVDRDYNVVIPPKYKQAGTFFEVGGYWRAIVTGSNGKDALIDTSGNSVIPSKYSSFRIRIGQEYYAQCFYPSLFGGAKSDILSTIDGHVVYSTSGMDQKTKDLLAKAIIYGSVSAAKSAIALFCSSLGYPLPDYVIYEHSKRARDRAWEEYQKTGSIFKALERLTG